MEHLDHEEVVECMVVQEDSVDHTVLVEKSHIDWRVADVLLDIVVHSPDCTAVVGWTDIGSELGGHSLDLEGRTILVVDSSVEVVDYSDLAIDLGRNMAGSCDFLGSHMDCLHLVDLAGRADPADHIHSLDLGFGRSRRSSCWKTS